MFNLKNINLKFKYINAIVTFVNQIILYFGNNDEILKYSKIKYNINSSYYKNIRIYKIYKRKIEKYKISETLKEFLYCFFTRINYKFKQFNYALYLKKYLFGILYLLFINVLNILEYFKIYKVVSQNIWFNKRLYKVNKNNYYRYINILILSLNTLLTKNKYARFIRYKNLTAIFIFMFLYLIVSIFGFVLSETFLYKTVLISKYLLFFVGVTMIVLSKYSKEKLVINNLKLTINSKLFLGFVFVAVFGLLNVVSNNKLMELNLLNILIALIQMIIVIIFYSTVVELFFRRVLMDVFVPYIGKFTTMVSSILFGFFMMNETILDVLLYTAVGYTFCILKKNGVGMVALILFNFGLYVMSNIVYPITGFNNGFYIYYVLTTMYVIILNICLILLFKNKQIIKYKGVHE